MADMILGSAQGAVDSLLGRLTSVLVEEAQLLGGVRGDVQFIKDEMESMNGFLMHVAEATGDNDGEEEDHQVRAWMKQVAEVAYASQNSVDLYVHSLGRRDPAAGLLGNLRRLPRLGTYMGLYTRQDAQRQYESVVDYYSYSVCYTEHAHIRLHTTPFRCPSGLTANSVDVADAPPHRHADPEVRSCEVGERRMRYDVRAPDRRGRGNRLAKAESASWQAAGASGDDDAKEQEDARRRALADAHPSDSYRDLLVKWLADEQDSHGEQYKLRVMTIQGPGGVGKTYIARSAYQDSFAMTSFDRKAWIEIGAGFSVTGFLQNMLAQVADPACQSNLDDTKEVLVEKLMLHLKGKKFLLVVDNVRGTGLFFSIISAFKGGNYCPDSAILATMQEDEIVSTFQSTSQYNFTKVRFDFRPFDFFKNNAISLLDRGVDMQAIISDIITQQMSSPLAIRLFLRDLYVNPNQNEEDLKSLCDRLRVTPNRYYYNYFQRLNNISRPVLMHIYNKLPSDCKNCLLYLSILPEDTTFIWARLIRRWVAEGMITKRGRLGVLDQAEHYFDLIVAHGLVTPTGIGITGKVKNFTMHDFIHEVFMEIAREDNFLNANLQSDLAHRLSIRSEVQLQLAENKQHATRSKASCWNICNHFKESDQTHIDHSNATQVFLESLSSSTTHLGLLEVLDLEDCKQLKDYHLKNICNHVFQLKYLSLRNTDITELPKQIDKLRYLETLDIRQTNVRAFAKNSVFLPKIKYLLAGHQTDCRRQGSSNSEETFLTIQMPKHVGGMTEVQVLSHISVSGSGDELSYIGNLPRLRKLGVALNGCDGAVSRHLYHAIGNLSKCLRSLSIRAIQLIANEENAGMDTEGVPLIPPKHLEKLEISGLGNGLPPWIGKLGILNQITLHKTFLTAGDISILGKLASLCCLRLRQESCGESTLTLETEEFQSLKFLIIECSDMRSISFGNGAAPKLKKIAWSSTEKQSLSGIEHLPRLQEIELTKGKFDLKKMKEEIAANQNNPVLKMK